MRDRVYDGKRIALSSDREKPYCLKPLAVEARSSTDVPEGRSTGPASTSGYLDEAEEGEEDPADTPGSGVHGDAEPEVEDQSHVAAEDADLDGPKSDKFDDDDDDLSDLEKQLATLDDDEVGS